MRIVFENHIMSRNTHVNWPPSRWRSVKDKCYANYTATTTLKDEIGVAIAGMRLHMVENVLKNKVNSMGYCRASHGNHRNEVTYVPYLRENISN